MNDGDPISTGLYSEPIRRDNYDMEEVGFRLLLPLRLHDRHDKGARMSDGSVVRPGLFI